MSKCDLAVVLEKPGGTFGPGDTVVGMVTVDVNQDCRCNGLTVTLRWATHGRGNRKTRTFATEIVFTGDWKAGEQHLHPFELTLPDLVSPSYAGTLLNLDWEVYATADIPWAFDPEASSRITVRVPPGVPCDPGPEFTQSAEAVATGNSAVLVITAAMLVLIAGVGFVIPLGIAGGSGPDRAEMAIVGLIVCGTVVPIGALVAWMGLRKQVAAKALGDIRVSGPTGAVHAGEEVAVTLGFTPPKAMTGAITATFTGTERCVSGSGTNKRTHTHELLRLEQTLRPQGTFDAGAPVEVTARFRLPADIAPSFEASENALRWEITLDVDIAGWPDWQQRVLLHVAP